MRCLSSHPPHCPSRCTGIGFCHAGIVDCAGIVTLFVLGIIALIMLALPPLLCWHCCPCCTGAAVVCGMVFRIVCSFVRVSSILNEDEDACKVTAQCKHSKGKEACGMRALMPVHQGWQSQCDKGSHTSATAQTRQLDGGNYADHYQWQRQPICYKGNNASLMTTLAWLQQRCHHDEGDNRHCNDGKDARQKERTELEREMSSSRKCEMFSLLMN